MGRWSLAALVLNCIIGSGIFGLPADIAQLLGAASPLAYLLVAAGMALIVACFAEVASYFTVAGGPYLYSRVALGRFVGIQVGWMAWLVRLTSAAANANLFVIYLGEFWKDAMQPVPRAAVLTLLVGILAAVNYRGVKMGAQLTNTFAVAKLLPLAILIVAGLTWLLFSNHDPVMTPAFTSGASSRDWVQAVLLLVFAYGGFEAALMPMGEARNPRRDAAFALFAAMAGVTLIYFLIQVVVIGAVPEPGVTGRPLAEAARHVLGPWGASFMSLAALISVYGYFTATLLSSPRLTFALAEQGDFPGFFAAVHRRFRTPHVSIVFFAVLVWALALWLDFRGNVTLSAVSRLMTYAPVCLALLVLRRKQPGQAAFRLPAGRLIAIAGILFSLLLLAGLQLRELPVIALTLALALANWLWLRWRRA